ncbi:MAG: hypothetical protein ACI8QC_001868 [Planctomycetota bacterium]|jgi:hypothetical protein
MADGRVLLEQQTSAGAQVVMAALRDATRVGVGAESVPGTDAERCFVLGHALHLTFLSPTRVYADARMGADVEFAGRQAHTIECTDNLGAPVQLYDDAESGLPLGMRLVEPGSDPEVPILFTVKDWRALGTLPVFHGATILHRGDRFEYAYTGIAVNGTESSRFGTTAQEAGGE